MSAFVQMQQNKRLLLCSKSGFGLLLTCIGAGRLQLGLDSSLSHGIAFKQCNQTVEGPSQIRYGM